MRASRFRLHHAVLITAFATLAAPVPARAQCPVIGGLGGTPGYGEGVVPKDDDGSSAFIDLSDAFPSGLSFFGASYTGVYVNINGDITFDAPFSGFTPFPFPSTSGTRMVAVFFTDVDTRAAAGTNNNIYYHIDSVGHRFIVTWLAVQRFPTDPTAGLNTFQIVLTARTDAGPGDFDVEYRYQAVNWISASGAAPAQIGFDAGDGVHFASHPASLTAAVADLEITASNHPSDCATGSFAYFIRASCGNGVVNASAQEECDTSGTNAGCSSLCTVTPGYACTYVDGQASTCTANCGNGNRNNSTEECDDGNNNPGDGCSPICRIEPGASCDISKNPSVCSNTCVVDGDCVGDAFCGNGGRCQPARTPGQACERDAMCQSDACVDGICCTAACSGGCATCALPGSVGTCTIFPAGPRAACGDYLCDGVSPACPTACGDDGDCVASSHCDGGACVADLGPGGDCQRDAACVSGACVDGVCCTAACSGACERCDLLGSEGDCEPLPNGTFESVCGAYACDGASGECPTSCGDDGDCTSDHHCAAGACVPDLGPGASCSRTEQCGVGVCTDGVCCDRACALGCESCTAVPGTCGPLVDGATPDADCGGHLCDGSGGACPTVCVDDTDCAASHHCQGGDCAPDLGTATACERPAQCSSGACADGLCCNAACSGACDRCDLTDHRGACTPVPDGTGEPSCGAYLCDGLDGQCPSACAATSDCVASHHCEGGACVLDRDDGTDCTLDETCASGECTDGVCCNAACDGPCDRCDLDGATGVCKVIADGSFVPTCGVYACDGVSSACPTSCGGDDDCAADHHCSAGVCAPDLTGGVACQRASQCTLGNCVDGVCCASACEGPCDRCDLEDHKGTCTPLADGTLVGACGVYACDGVVGTCPTSCSADDDCAAAYHCEGGACEADRAPGDICTRIGQCASGHCTDGVCCDKACGGACERCDAPNAAGTCKALADGTFIAECGPTACDGVSGACATTCTNDNDCAATHHCADGLCTLDVGLGVTCTRTAQCGAATCVDGVCCNAACSGSCDRCDLDGREGQCLPLADGTFVAACGALACDGVSSACPGFCQTDGDCASAFFCDAFKACSPDLVTGKTCTRTSQCTSGFCVDSVCCDTACEDGCARCNAPNDLGVCQGEPDGAPGTGCGPYLCGGALTCPSQCAGDGDCEADHHCDDGECRADLAKGSTCDRATACVSGFCADGVCCNAACDGPCDRCDHDGSGVCKPIGKDTAVASCGPYLCGGSAACPTSCANDGDCVADHFCDDTSHCVPDREDGLACADAGECTSGACAQGVCCDAACDGPCEGCDQAGHPGECRPLPDGTFAGCGPLACDGVARGCTFCGSHADCASDHHCDVVCNDSDLPCVPEGNCVPDLVLAAPCDGDEVCASGHCVDGLCCDAACSGACERCDAAATRGKCSAEVSGTIALACGAYRCGGGSECPVACANDAGCVAEHVCEDHACVPEAALGQDCTRDAACASGRCAGGLCCDAACNGPCEACDLDGLEGQCSPLDVGTLVPDCGNYLCDGLAGMCPALCETDASCSDTSYCGAESCLPALGDGATCARDAMCLSGFCDDSRCITLTIDKPLDDALLNDATPVIEGRAPPGARVTVHVGDQEAEVIAGPDGAWSWTPPSPVADGPVVVSATTGESSSVTIEIVIDTAPPALVVQAPVTGTVRPSGDVTVSGTSEALADIVVVVAAVQRSTKASEAGIWSIAFTGLADGSYTASVTATDGAGNVSTGSTSFVVDSLAPTIEVTTPVDGSTSNVATVTLGGRGKSSGTLTITHGDDTLTGAVDASGNWSVALGEVDDGTWTDLVTITDGAGRQASDEVTYTIDTVAPALAVTAPTEDATLATAEPELAGTSEAGASVTVTLDGQPVEVTLNPDGSWSATVATPLEPGEHTLRVTARDAAGNTSEREVTFTIQTGLIAIRGGSSCASAVSGDLPLSLILSLPFVAWPLFTRRRRRGLLKKVQPQGASEMSAEATSWSPHKRTSAATPRMGLFQQPARRTGMRVARLAALLVIAAVQQTAAQEVDPRLFDARVAPGSLIGLDTTSVVGHLDFYAGLAATIANDELVGDDPAGTLPRGPLRERLVSTLGVGLGFFDALALEVALPLHTTEEIVGNSRQTAFGIGDLRVSARWRIVGPDLGHAGVGLALQLAAHVPTGSAPFGTDGGLVLDPRLVFEWRSAGGIGLVVEAAYRLRETRVIADLAIGDEVRWGAGIELPFGALGASVPLALVSELEGGIGLATAAADPDGAASARKLPVEARLGLRWHAADWALTAAAGTGITDGYGTPDYRFVLGFTWGPATLPRPPSDAVVTTAIDPASAPEPAFPPASGFAVAAGTSGPGGPSGTALPPEVKAALDQALAADPDPDGDGVPVPADRCPAEREDPDGHDDGDGCPDLDDDGDGVVDAKDKCLDQKETPNGVDDDDGCPDEGQAGVVASGGRIELTQTIEFNSGSDVLAPSAAPILAQVAAVLKANPQVKRVRIEGHTDNEGDEEMNVDLAERRAGRVRLTLVKAGVAPERLLPKGFGATKPIASNTTPEGRKKNRRVALEVIDPPPPGAPRVDFEGTP